MGGVLARVDQWRKFSKVFEQIKATYGFETFHTRKFKAKSGDFRSWSDEKRLALMRDLAFATNDAFTESVAMTLQNEVYENDYKAGDKPRKLRLDSKYGLCFRQCLLLFILEAGKRKHRKRLPKLHIVLESGHANVGDAVRIFNEMKKEYDQAGFDILETITIADKDKCDPLMIADFIAHSTYMIQGRAMAGLPRITPIRPPARGQSGITHLEFKPGGLASVKEQLAARYGQGRR